MAIEDLKLNESGASRLKHWQGKNLKQSSQRGGSKLDKAAKSGDEEPKDMVLFCEFETV